MEATITIKNLVDATKLAKNLDLLKIMEVGLEDPEYNKTKFLGLVYRIKNQKAAFLIFTSCKLICIGTKNIERSYSQNKSG